MQCIAMHCKIVQGGFAHFISIYSEVMLANLNGFLIIRGKE
jgi:hypothetical protein